MTQKILFVGLLLMSLLAGVQSYRLQGEKAEHDSLKAAVAAAVREEQIRAVQHLKNKERTDEEYTRAVDRAFAAGVRSQANRVRARPTSVALGGDESAICFDRGKLIAELTGWVARHAGRLDAVLAGISRLGDERFTGVARASEGVAAAARACRAWAIGGSETSETGPTAAPD